MAEIMTDNDRSILSGYEIGKKLPVIIQELDKQLNSKKIHNILIERAKLNHQYIFEYARSLMNILGCGRLTYVEMRLIWSRIEGLRTFILSAGLPDKIDQNDAVNEQDLSKSAQGQDQWKAITYGEAFKMYYDPLMKMFEQRKTERETGNKVETVIEETAASTNLAISK